MRSQTLELGLSGLLLLPALVSGVTFDCRHLIVDGHSYNLEQLGGPHTVSWYRQTPPSTKNTTFTVDICSNLKRPSDADKNEWCTLGTRICGVEYNYNTVEEKGEITQVIPIAGNYETSHGRGLDPQITRFKGSASNSDAERDGVRVELNGGKYPDTRKGTLQKAIIEFECDATRTGLEGTDGQSAALGYTGMATGGEEEDEDEDDDDEVDDRNNSLRFLSYRDEGNAGKEVGTLRLHWRTKYACETVKGEPETDKDAPAKKSAGWGFFTWLIIILFLGVAGYLIFGSWLNYSRYGARGWDLLPHGDTIRDLPYLVKDWGRAAVGVVQGGGARGGYSAV